MGALHGAPICELRGGSSRPISQPRPRQGKRPTPEGSEAEDSAAVSPTAQVPRSKDKVQPSPEGSTNRLSRPKIKRIIRKPLVKFLRKARILRRPKNPQEESMTPLSKLRAKARALRNPNHPHNRSMTPLDKLRAKARALRDPTYPQNGSMTPLDKLRAKARALRDPPHPQNGPVQDQKAKVIKKVDQQIWECLKRRPGRRPSPQPELEGETEEERALGNTKSQSGSDSRNGGKELQEELGSLCGDRSIGSNTSLKLTVKLQLEMKLKLEMKVKSVRMVKMLSDAQTRTGDLSTEEGFRGPKERGEVFEVADTVAEVIAALPDF
ncbi:hypothetical protein B0T20DRAFT_498051 [Sordaria brevicollis]|uniref:Uncharacterized protein n=1 Tax=Sordaria brevicollis TaxID=83679 RepID=A0AAE0UBQ1_SORBR|nr:hypothetical protein B0T20DRAFT_498051 [Sordaria brevicollis]